MLMLLSPSCGPVYILPLHTALYKDSTLSKQYVTSFWHFSAIQFDSDKQLNTSAFSGESLQKFNSHAIHVIIIINMIYITCSSD